MSDLAKQGNLCLSVGLAARDLLLESWRGASVEVSKKEEFFKKTNFENITFIYIKYICSLFIYTKEKLFFDY
jgi:hypothetical protein